MKKLLFGMNLSRYEYDRIALNRISAEVLRKEIDLFDSKWFDYRDMHPTKATYLFTHEFTRAYKNMTAKMIDVVMAKSARGFSHENFMDSKDAFPFWKARQAADSLGIPYGLYISFLMNARFEMGIPFVPRANMFYSEWALKEAEERWMNFLSHTTVEAKPKLTECISNEYQHFACQVISTRANLVHGLAEKMFIKPVITEKIALNYFSSSQIADAKQIAIKAINFN